jgi:hypothetical protein
VSRVSVHYVPWRQLVPIPLLEPLNWSEASHNYSVKLWNFDLSNAKTSPASVGFAPRRPSRTLPLEVSEMNGNKWKLAQNVASPVSDSEGLCPMPSAFAADYVRIPFLKDLPRYLFEAAENLCEMVKNVLNVKISSASGGFAPRPPRTIPLEIIRNGMKTCAKCCVSRISMLMSSASAGLRPYPIH